MKVVAALIVVLGASCGSPYGSPVGSGQPSATVSTSIRAEASAAPTAGGPLAVLYSLVGPDYPRHGSYRIVLVRSDGRTVASATPSQPSDFLVYPPSCLGQPMCAGSLPDWIPLISISRTRVYYLDGDATVRWLRRDGGTGIALKLGVGPMQRAAFAVTPDDRRIAVSIVDYSKPPQVTVHLTTQDLPNGKAVDLFDSTSSVTEWPIEWHGQNLVLAISDASPHSIFGDSTNPYGASTGYHVVDSVTAARLATLGFSTSQLATADCIAGLLGPAGTACATRLSVGSQGWDGDFKSFGPTPFQARDGGMRWPVLSPNGQRLAWEMGQHQFDPLTLLEAGKTPTLTSIPGQPMGWLDDHHLLAVRYANQKGSFVIGDPDTGAIADTGLPPDFRYFGPLGP